MGEYGFMLLAAYFLRSPNRFSKISIKGQLHLTPRSVVKWEEMEMLNLIPDKRSVKPIRTHLEEYILSDTLQTT